MAGGCGKGKGSGKSNKSKENSGNNKNNGNKRNNNNNKSKKKSLLGHIYSVGTTSQTSDYELITKFLINHIKKTYKQGADIAHALTTKTEYDFSRDVPTEGTVDASITGNTLRDKAKESLKLVYEQEIKRYVDRKLDYITNKVKAYRFLIN